MFLKISCSLLVLMAGGVAAKAADRNVIEISMTLACPQARHIRVKPHGGYTALVKADQTKQANQCLSRAYRQALKNPYPVNMNGIPVATRIKVANGKIILY